MSIVFPPPLKKGDRVGVTASSSGVEPVNHRRLDLVLNGLRKAGFEIVEGHCLRDDRKHVSAPAKDRARELQKFWKDPSIKAILPPWGGELLIEILSQLDWEELAAQPKWFSGYSDLSTFSFALTLRTGVASLHGPNLMDLIPEQIDGVTQRTLQILSASAGARIEQRSFAHYQVKSVPYAENFEAPFNVSQPVEWKSLRPASRVRISGRTIGGCLDTLMCLVGTPFGDLPGFVRRHRQEGVVLFLENCEQNPCAVARALWQMRLAGWFNDLAGIVFGRSAVPNATQDSDLDYREALESALGDLALPVILDADIGHRPPQFAIVNGALGEWTYENGSGALAQTLG